MLVYRALCYLDNLFPSSCNRKYLELCHGKSVGEANLPYLPFTLSLCFPVQAKP